ncbi:MAG: GTPase HflX [Alphaproteobacteria bacterium]|nr:GTPase HflX [Alphaproteobacteria bacterium]
MDAGHDPGLDPPATAGSSGRALVLHPALKQRRGQTDEAAVRRDPEARLAEAASLTHAIGLEVAHAEVVVLPAAKPATLFGSGRVETLGELIEAMHVTVVVVDSAVTPVQQRNLEKAWKCKVIDRTGLILEIFGERARTREGRLQVELAHLTYQRSRLVRTWTHLERQRGGFGFLGGPGESQLEIDRRLIGERIAKLRKELDQVVRTRELHRKSRRKVPYPIVALVGYTNAGKSTLFNRLTRAEVLAEDMLFATLDPTMRVLKLPDGRRIILSDTVGFISDLPTHLVAAFRATLEEVLEADIILHVRDIAHADSDAQAADVEDVLRDLGVEPDTHENLIEIWNKIDLLTPERHEALTSRADGPDHVAVSALTGEGCDGLLAELARRLGASRQPMTVTLDAGDGATLAWLHRHGEVLGRKGDDGRVTLTVALDEAELGQLRKRLGPGAIHAV